MGRFPIDCCVAGCKTRASSSRNAQNRMFRFVAEAPRKTTTEKTRSLYKKRFQLWLSVLDISAERAKTLWICRDHFVEGRPAFVNNPNHVDWVPTLKLSDDVNENGLISPSKIKLCREVAIVLENLNPQFIDDNTREDSIDSETAANEEHTESVVIPDLEGPFCRLCLKKNDILRPLYPISRAPNSHLVQLIEEIAYIRINFETDYNSFACHQCQEKLELFHRFRQQWQCNDSLLAIMRQRNHCITPSPLVTVPVDNLLETVLAIDQEGQQMSFTEPTVAYEAVDQSMEIEDEFKAEVPELALSTVLSTEVLVQTVQSSNDDYVDEAEKTEDHPEHETICLSSESEEEVDMPAPEQVHDVNSSETGDNDRDIQEILEHCKNSFSKTKKKNKSKRVSLRSAHKDARGNKPLNSTV